MQQYGHCLYVIHNYDVLGIYDVCVLNVLNVNNMLNVANVNNMLNVAKKIIAHKIEIIVDREVDIVYFGDYGKFNDLVINRL